MKSVIRAASVVVVGVAAFAAGGCAGRPGATNSTVRVDPHHGQEWEHGMNALGNVLAPYSKLPVGERAEKQRALTSYGTLLDLTSQPGR